MHPTFFSSWGNCYSIKLSSSIGAKMCWSGETSGFQGNRQMGKVFLIPYQSRTTCLFILCAALDGQAGYELYANAC